MRAVMEGHSQAVSFISMSADGSTCASASEHGEIRQGTASGFSMCTPLCTPGVHCLLPVKPFDFSLRNRIWDLRTFGCTQQARIVTGAIGVCSLNLPNSLCTVGLSDGEMRYVPARVRLLHFFWMAAKAFLYASLQCAQPGRYTSGEDAVDGAQGADNMCRAYS